MARAGLKAQESRPDSASTGWSRAAGRRPALPSPGLCYSALVEEKRFWRPLPGLKHWPGPALDAPRMRSQVPKRELHTLGGGEGAREESSPDPHRHLLHPCAVTPRATQPTLLAPPTGPLSWTCCYRLSSGFQRSL